MKIQEFYDLINESEDLNDNLQDLCNFLQEKTSATGVYIGHLTKPFKKISEDAKEKDHIDDQAVDEIQILHAAPCT